MIDRVWMREGPSLVRRFVRCDQGTMNRIDTVRTQGSGPHKERMFWFLRDQTGLDCVFGIVLNAKPIDRTPKIFDCAVRAVLPNDVHSVSSNGHIGMAIGTRQGF